MTSVFFKTATDGWRVGVADGFPNSATVTVMDASSRLRETVRAEDVYIPPAEQAALLRMGDDEQFVATSDVVQMRPPPLELPPLVECLRLRHAAGRELLFLGDNVAVSLAPSAEEEEGLAERIVAALQATGRAQLVAAAGDRSMLQCAAIGTSIAERMGASDDYVAKLRAAHLVMATFTHTIDGRQRALRKLELCSPDKEPSHLSFAQLQYSLFDYEFIASAPQFNFVAVGFLIYAFNAEEKDRCYMTKRQTNYALQPTIHDLDLIAQLRKKYFAFTKAMTTLGFEIEVQLTVFARVAAVLHLLEVDFTPEGEVKNLHALRNAARLIQTDFNLLCKILTTREACSTAAKLLYLSIFKYLVRRVNAVLNPEGAVVAPSVTVLGVPQPELGQGSGAPVSSRYLALHTLIEDLHQCFFRSSEQEMVQWQREGFCVSEELQSVFDGADNYKLLKVLKGRGGILAALHMRDPSAVVEQLKKVSRSDCCDFEPTTGALTVRHTFGAVRYQIATSATDAAPLDTVHHARFQPMRDFLIGNTDVDTQEALCLVEQADDREDTHIAHDWAELKPTIALLSADVQTTMYWWLKVIEVVDGFNGQLVADRMTAEMVHPVAELRSRLPHRYIACPAEFIAANFANLLPLRGGSGAAAAAAAAERSISSSARARAEQILRVAEVHHRMGKDHVLIEARGLLALRGFGRERRERYASLVQAAARSVAASLAVNERVRAWMRAVGEHEEEQRAAQRLHKWLVDNAARFRDERLELQENESEDRATIRDECWVAWVALQTEVQQLLESIIQRNVVRSLEEESRLIRKTIDNSHRAAIEEVTRRIQERLVAQGRHLDAVVEQHALQDGASARRVRKMEEISDKLLRTRVAQEEARLELEGRLLAKQTRNKRIAAERERKREQLRQELWLRQERDRAARVRMEKTREAVTTQMREGFVVDDIERAMTQRLKEEIVERQRREKMAREHELKRKREERERQLLAQQKQHTRAVLRREAAMRRQEERERATKRREEAAILAAQERERAAAERLQREEEKRSKVLTRALLKAHNIMQAPVVYEQSARGVSVRSRSSARRIDPVGAEGFVMAGSKVTHRRMLDNNTWDGIISYHKARQEGTVEAALASAASRSRERSASPRSVFSL